MHFGQYPSGTDEASALGAGISAGDIAVGAASRLSVEAGAEGAPCTSPIAIGSCSAAAAEDRLSTPQREQRSMSRSPSTRKPENAVNRSHAGQRNFTAPGPR